MMGLDLLSAAYFALSRCQQSVLFGRAHSSACVFLARKACDCCPYLTNASRIEGGRLDCDRIGAYSRWQGNLDAKLVIVGQDFADVDGFLLNRGWAREQVQTNLTLMKLVAEAGVRIDRPRYGSSDDQLFFTNAILCMKQGGMQAAVSDSCFRECGTRFLRPTIEVVAPRVVVTLGTKSLRAVCWAFNHVPPATLSEAVARPISITNATVLMPLYHPSRTVLNTMRSYDAQRIDWREVGRLLERRQS
jgi:DNA polymerase